MIPIPFLQGQVYKRSRIHERFGGNPQSGISTCRDFIFIFSGRSGVQHGYRDQWENPDVFSYTGEGQVGDMKFTRGNLALRDHLKSGRRVLLFVQDARSFVRYESELEFLDFDYFLTTARDGKERRGIKFFFKRAGASLNYPIDQVHSALWLETGGQYVPDLPNTTERSGLVTSRVGQGAYRKSILFRWEFKCAVTGYSTNEVLIASHIVPWKGAKDAERLDVNNGILLSPTYDALFDRHLISFEDNGRIILPGTFERNHYDLLGVTGREQIANFKEGNIPYLARHRMDLIKGVLE